MRKAPVVVLVAITVAVIIGQAVAYYVPDRQCSIHTNVVDDTIEYTIDSEAPFQCTELHLVNTLDIKQFYVYYDPDYSVASGDMSIPSAYYFLEKTFDMYSGVSVDVKDANEIRTLIDSGSHDFGLIFISGALPDTIHDGTLASPIMQWLNDGGYVIWSGDLFGRQIATRDGIIEVPDYQNAIALPLFGSDSAFNSSDEPEFGNERIHEGLTGPAGIYFADTTYGVDESKLTLPHIVAGYTDGTYSSIAIMKISNGNLCHFGDYASAQESGYLAHVAVLGLTYSSETSSFNEGSVRGYGYTQRFTDSVDEKHVVIVHDIRWAKVWIYDRAESRFV